MRTPEERAGLEKVFESPQTASSPSLAVAMIAALGRLPTPCCSRPSISLGAYAKANTGPNALAQLRCSSCGHASAEMELSRESIIAAQKNGTGSPGDDLPIRLVSAWEISFDTDDEPT